jgi:low temperature requirement protein LtrA
MSIDEAETGPTPTAAEPFAEEPRVSTLELFFDLVFVFTITQLTALLEGGLSVEVVAQVVLVFVVVFWMYGGYAWLTNAVPPDRPIRRLLLILGMGAFFICALALPRVFDGDGVFFGIGYLIVVVVHAGLYSRTYGSGVFLRLAPLNVLAAISVLVAGALPRPLNYALWALAIAIEFIAPRIAGTTGAFELRAAHFVERHGLLLLIAIGESVIAVGVGAGDRPLEAGTIVGALLGLAVAAGLWWTYFGGDEEIAERAMSDAGAIARFGLAINGYFFAFIPMLLGIVATAAGIHGAIAHLGDRIGTGDAVILGGGVAIYLAGESAFRRAMGAGWNGRRLLAPLAAAATSILGTAASGGAELAALAMIPVVIAVLDSRGGPPPAAIRRSSED